MEQFSQSENAGTGKEPAAKSKAGDEVVSWDIVVPADFFSESLDTALNLPSSPAPERIVAKSFARIAEHLNSIKERGILILECNPISVISTVGVDLTLTLPDQTATFRNTYIWGIDPVMSARKIKSLEGDRNLRLGRADVELDWVIVDLERGDQDKIKIASRIVSIVPNDREDSYVAAERCRD